MSYLLLIHTSLDEAFVALTEDDKIIAVKKNGNPREHGAFVHEAIEGLVRDSNLALNRIAAIGITTGPGSYTGIRVGLSAAKGLGYALGIPLVLCSCLKALAATAIHHKADKSGLYVSLIHARQNEYYSGVYDHSLNTVEEEALVEIGESDFADSLPEGNHLFFGIGLENFTTVTGIEPTLMVNEIDEQVFAKIIFDDFAAKRLTDAASAIPLYLKEVFIRNLKK